MISKEPRTEKSFRLDIVSQYRSPVYGFCIFWITLFHAYAINKVDYSFGHRSLALFRTIMNSGNVGVDCFLLLSGICLFYSYHKKPDYIAFEINRAFLLRVTLLRFWVEGDQSIWFVSLIALLYLIYPAVYSYIYRNDNNIGITIRTALLMGLSYIAIVLFANSFPEYFAKIEIAVTRIPVFILGCGMGKAVYKRTQINGVLKIIPALFLALFIVERHFGMLGTFHDRLFCLVGGTGLAYVLSFAFRWLTDGGKRRSLITAFFTMLGSFSLEIYLSTGVWNQILRKTEWYKMGTLSGYLLMLLVAYAFAYIIYKIERRLLNKRENNEK